MKINVVAATGQLGRKIVAELIAQGAKPEDIIASVRTVEKAKDMSEQGIEVRRADYDEPETLKEGFS